MKVLKGSLPALRRSCPATRAHQTDMIPRAGEELAVCATQLPKRSSMRGLRGSNSSP